MFETAAVRHRTDSRSPVDLLVAFFTALWTNDTDTFLNALEWAFGTRFRMKFEVVACWLFGVEDAGQLGLRTLLAAFVVVIAGMVVVIVLDEFDQSIGTPSNTDLSNSSGDLLSGFASMVSLVEPLLLIAIGVVIIGLIRRVQ